MNHTKISNEAREAAEQCADAICEAIASLMKAHFVTYKPTNSRDTIIGWIETCQNAATKELREQLASMVEATPITEETVKWEELRQERDQLREQLTEALNPIHTCHNECQRPACVLRRENEALREALGFWVAWYRDAEATGAPIHATRELLSKP